MFTHETVIKILLDMVSSMALRETPNKFIPGKNPGRENEVVAYIENSRKMDIWLTLQEVVMALIEENDPSHDKYILQVSKGIITDNVIYLYHTLRDNQMAALSLDFVCIPASIYPSPSIVNLCKGFLVSMVEMKEVNSMKDLITERIKNSDPSSPENTVLQIKAVFLENQKKNSIHDSKNEHVKIITHDLLRVTSSIFDVDVMNGNILN